VDQRSAVHRCGAANGNGGGGASAVHCHMNAEMRLSEYGKKPELQLHGSYTARAASG
jgi:hypothetical protein